ncbi:MAG: DNA polymerase III subunit delta [Oscillospiraceae bacterium]|nr:DNA polymerase III subunit delta [Oscillospiraceae bacterium]
MAKQTKPKFNYAAEIRALREHGPERLYLLYGPEEYLRERFAEALRKECVPEDNEFSVRRLNGPALDFNELGEAVNAMPFFTERTYVEVRDFDLNRCRDADWERLRALLSDIPDWCTVAFVQSEHSAPDGRLAAVKGVKKLGKALEFTEQEAGALVSWIAGRCKALGKTISRADAEYLIFLSGTRMQRLIPEIEKAAAFSAGNAVTRTDIDATVDRQPEADVFAMTDAIARRRFDEAAGVLADLLGNKDNHPIMLTALIGQQLRRMYACRAGQEAGRSRGEIMELCSLRYDFLYDRLSNAAKPYSAAQLGKLTSLCAEYDYRMKSSGTDPALLLRELFARIAAGEG